MAEAPDDAIDRLYGLALDEFIPQRDALSKELRDAGKRAEATAVKKLGKPTVAAWAVNQAVRSQPRAARELWAAGDTLAAAQEAVLSGKGSGGDLREAADRERAALDPLVDAARGLLTSSGGDLSDTTIDRVRATLQAAAIDADAREDVAAGRATRERAPRGLFGEEMAAGAPARGRSGGEEKPARGRSGGTGSEDKAPRGRSGGTGTEDKPARGRAAKRGGSAGSDTGRSAKRGRSAESDTGRSATRGRSADSSTGRPAKRGRSDEPSAAERKRAREEEAAARKREREEKAARGRARKAAEARVARAENALAAAEARTAKAAEQLEDARARERDAVEALADARAELRAVDT
jgi:hypothetical protein